MSESDSVLGPDGAPAASDFFCPYCGTKNPPYDFRLNGGGNLQLQLSFVTVVCGGSYRVMRSGGPEERTVEPCRRILGVSIVEVQILGRAVR